MPFEKSHLMDLCARPALLLKTTLLLSTNHPTKILLTNICKDVARKRLLCTLLIRISCIIFHVNFLRNLREKIMYWVGHTIV